MKEEIFDQLTEFGVALLAALLIWSYYRRRTFPRTARYSTFGPRFWTGTIDALVLWPIGFITWTLSSLSIPNGLAALLIIVENLAWLFYTVVMHGRYGQTVGKMVTKVRVVDFRTEGRISWRQAWLREGIPMLLSLGMVVQEVAAMLKESESTQAVTRGQALVATKPFNLLLELPGWWFVAEAVTMLTNEKRRALHDFIAGTIVVRTNIEPEKVQASTDPMVAPG
jgi:uncharacterized RDD family membrane protein YckC